MEPVAQTAKKSPVSRISKSGEKGLSMLKAGRMAVHTIKPGTGQTLHVGHPGDKFEREANQMADRVMSTGHLQSGNAKAGLNAFKSTGSVAAGTTIHQSSSTGELLQRKSHSHRMTVVPSYLPDDEKKLRTKPAATHLDHQEHRLPASFHTLLNSSVNGGHPLGAEATHFMNNAFHADFSKVVVHSDTGAIKMNHQLQSEAFTYKNHIYFNSGKYEPASQKGRHLLAHELTHVVQQGYAGKAAETDQEIQPSWLSSIGDAISSAEDWVSDTIEAGIHKFLEKATEVVQKVPGYKALRVVLGHDPITKEEVPFNGHNFIDAALDLMPFGTAIRDKLVEMDALTSAEKWVDTKITEAKELIGGIASSIANFISGIKMGDLAHPVDLLEHAGRLIADGISAVTQFAIQTATELVNIIKKFLLKVLVAFIKDHTRLYPLLTVILGHDPVTGEEVARNGTNILTAFLLISEDGAQQKEEMEKTGTFQKAAKWIDTAISVFSGAYAEIIAGFHSIWDNMSVDYVLHPDKTFETIFNTFAPPITRVLAFIASAAKMILKLIKDVLLKKIATEARQHQGYPLLTVLLGEDPFTGEKVPRNVENLIHGFMSLMDGGEEQFKQMKESGAIERASARVNAAVDALNFTKEYIIGLFMSLWNSFSIKDLFNPIAAFARIIATLIAPIKRLIAFVIEIVKIAVHVILEIMQFPFDLIDSIMAKVAQAFDTIKKDPVGFLKNLLRAIKEGFTQFFRNIGRHLLDGLKAWLSSELKDAGVKAPEDYTFKGILGWVLDTLHITLDSVWKKIEKKIGAEKVAKIKGMIDKLDGAWSFIKDIQQRGLIAIWERIKEKLSNLWDMVLDFIKGWMVENIMEKVTEKLLSMLDPTGIMAVVNSTIALYKAIQSAIQYMKRMLQIVNTFVGGILEIAKGNIKTAAGFLEDSLTQGVPVMIGFLANQVGLAGIGKKVGAMIDKVRDKVDGAIQWIVDKAWAIGGPMLMKVIDLVVNIGDKVEGAWEKAKAMVKSGVSKVTGFVKGGINKAKDFGKGVISSILNWWKTHQDFTARDGSAHHLFFQGEGANAKLMVASTVTYMDDALTMIAARIITADQKKTYDANLEKAKELNQNAKSFIRSIQKPEYTQTLSEAERNEKIKQLQKKLKLLSESMEGLVPLLSNEHNAVSSGDTLKDILCKLKPLDYFTDGKDGTTNQVLDLPVLMYGTPMVKYFQVKGYGKSERRSAGIIHRSLDFFLKKLNDKTYNRIDIKAMEDRRRFYLGPTPDKESDTGEKVKKRMALIDKYNKQTKEFKDTRNTPSMGWLPEKQADMGHLVDAVLWWNTVGRFGIGAKKISAFMKDPDNYELEEHKHNITQGAKIGEDFKVPVS